MINEVLRQKLMQLVKYVDVAISNPDIDMKLDKYFKNNLLKGTLTLDN